MDRSETQMSFNPPIAGGVNTIFDRVTEDLRKIAITSVIEQFHSLRANAPFIFQKALQLFLTISEDSTAEQCFEFIQFVKNISLNETDFMPDFEKETPVTDFYNYFCKFRTLIEGKLSAPLKLWKQTEEDAISFPETYGKILQKLKDVQYKVEKARDLRDKMMPEQTAKGEKLKKKISASEDFKSLHPFFVKKNAEEHMEKIAEIKQMKIDALKDEKNTAELNFKEAILKYRKEIQNIIEETLNTKSFIEWLEERNYAKLKEYEEEIKQEWHDFTTEMEQSRKLGEIYIEKHAVYQDIERVKADRVRSARQNAAARLIQNYWRDYAARKEA